MHSHFYFKLTDRNVFRCYPGLYTPGSAGKGRISGKTLFKSTKYQKLFVILHPPSTSITLGKNEAAGATDLDDLINTVVVRNIIL